jgi:hypothetical protein
MCKYSCAGGRGAIAHVEGQRVYAGQIGVCAGQYQQTQWTAINAVGATGCVDLYVDGVSTLFVTCTGSVLSGILNITTKSGNRTSQFIRQISILNQSAVVLKVCNTIGTDFNDSGTFSTPTISIINTDQIRIQVCNPTGAKSMAYFSGIEMIQ